MPWSVAAVAEGLHGWALLTYHAVSVDVTGRERYVLVCVPLQKARNNKVTYSQRLSQFVWPSFHPADAIQVCIYIVVCEETLSIIVLTWIFKVDPLSQFLQAASCAFYCSRTEELYFIVIMLSLLILDTYATMHNQSLEMLCQSDLGVCWIGTGTSGFIHWSP